MTREERRKFDRKFRKLQEEGELLELKRQLKKKKHEIRHPKKQKMQTSKLLMWIILLDCFAIQIYSCWAMIYMRDLSALYTLITSIAGEGFAYLIYSAKSMKENSLKIQLDNQKDECEILEPIVQNNDEDGIG